MKKQPKKKSESKEKKIVINAPREMGIKGIKVWHFAKNMA